MWCRVEMQIVVDERCLRGTMQSSYWLLGTRVAGWQHIFTCGGAYMPVTPNLGGHLLREKRARRRNIRSMDVKGAENVKCAGNLFVEKWTPVRRRSGVEYAANMGRPAKKDDTCWVCVMMYVFLHFKVKGRGIAQGDAHPRTTSGRVCEHGA